MSTSRSSAELIIPIATTLDETIADEGNDRYYYDETENNHTNGRLRRHKNTYMNIAEDIDIDLDTSLDIDDNNSNGSTAAFAPNMYAKISGVVIAPQFNGKQVQILSYNSSDETWTVQFTHYNNEMQKYLNIREEFLVFMKGNRAKNKNQNSNSKIKHKQLLKLQTCGYYILLAFIVISCTCLLLTPFWSFSSLIFGRNDGFIYYLSYTFFCGLMCLIIWSKKLSLSHRSQSGATFCTHILAEFRQCSIESLICYVFYMFCCVLLWGMASYFGGFFFIYLWYCSQEMHHSYKRCNYFDKFLNKYNRKYKDRDRDIIKRVICVYYYCLMNFETNIHKIYRTFIMNAYLKSESFDDFDSFTVPNPSLFYSKHWFPNINLCHNLPFIAGIAGYHFMIWFAVFYLRISDWSFLITVCNDILLLLCLLTAIAINFVYYNKCKKQITLHCLTYFNLENVQSLSNKQSLPIVNKEVDNLYLELNQRIEAIAIIRQFPSYVPPHISDIIVQFVYL